ncbi:hypothetical protein [uncultured Ruegeria sp.]|uniref:hypothetical protein n=1 Tax=uncultured Ruegeria sp. TaxID=259304 RepID=UPI0026374C3C|nr:hypothetical protein [uncultured Ruegeria sp.]
MKHMLLALLVGFSPIIANANQSDLAQSIMNAGRSGSDDRRTTVLVDDCTVQTLVFEPFENQGLVLYSMFEFDLSWTDIILADKKRGEYFFAFNAEQLKDEAALFNFRTVSPYMALHEMPNYRIRKRKDGSDSHVRTPSSRQGADGYHFIENHDFVFIMDNLPSLEQARAFVSGLRQYQSDYCRLSS